MKIPQRDQKLEGTEKVVQRGGHSIVQKENSIKGGSGGDKETVLQIDEGVRFSMADIPRIIPHPPPTIHGQSGHIQPVT